MEGKDLATWEKMALAVKEEDYAGRVRLVFKKEIYSSLTD